MNKQQNKNKNQGLPRLSKAEKAALIRELDTVSSVRQRNRPGRKGRGAPRDLSRKGRPAPPSAQRMPDKHRFENVELFASDVLGSTTSLVRSFSLNPGLSAIHPWGSDVARKYEKYRYDYCRLRFARGVSEFATGGTKGKVVLQFDYDASDANPTTKTQMTAAKPNKIGMPCDDVFLEIDCARAFDNGPKYVRSGGVGAGDVKMFDIGKFHFGAFGTADANSIGDLYIEYGGWLFNPVQESSSVPPANSRVAYFQNTASQSLATTVAEQMELATETANGIEAVNTAGSIVLPVGNYRFDGHINATDSASETFTLVVDIQKNGVSLFLNSAPSIKCPTTTTTQDLTVPAIAFATSDGDDAFTFVCTLTGAAGTLAVAAAVLLIQAV